MLQLINIIISTSLAKVVIQLAVSVFKPAVYSLPGMLNWGSWGQPVREVLHWDDTASCMTTFARDVLIMMLMSWSMSWIAHYRKTFASLYRFMMVRSVEVGLLASCLAACFSTVKKLSKSGQTGEL